MLLHAGIHWPEEVGLEAWPMALEYAVYIWNRLPHPDTGIAPIEYWSKSRQINTEVLHNMHTWGCPAYVLDPTLQDGKKIPCWQPRSRRGQFMGMSKRHASTIGMIRNVLTGAISPQFHVMYDDNFTTLPSSTNPDQAEPPPNWQDLLTYSRMRVVNDEDNPPQVGDEWLTNDELST
jgi:hypothetical protein